MVINKKVSKIEKFSILQITFFLLKFAGIVFVEIVFFVRIVFVTSIISSHITTESPIILFIYLSIMQTRVLGYHA